MSTRSTIYNSESIHIYEETITHEIVFEFRLAAKKNEIYKEPSITLEELKVIYDQVGRWLSLYPTDEQRESNKISNQKWIQDHKK